MKKTITILSLAFLFSLLLAACGTSGTAEMVLDKPEYIGEAANGKPEFSLSWNKFPGADSYEVAFYAQGEDSYGRGAFAIRDTKEVYEGNTKTHAIMLQGVYTDTVRYRIKVRPRIGMDLGSDPTEYIWSNIWEINFVNGEYTITETTADFDEEIVAEQVAEPAPDDTDVVSTETSPSPTAPLEHVFPEQLGKFLAEEQGNEIPASPDEITKLYVNVNHCEYGEPTQEITDPQILEDFRNAVAQMEVTGLEDTVDSTGTYFGYHAVDKDDNTVISFSIQDGLLMQNDGRYALVGLPMLTSIDGILLSEEWDEFWDAYYEKRDAYEATVKPEGMPLLDAAGYDCHNVNEAGADKVSFLSIYINGNNDVERFSTTDPAEITKIMETLQNMTVTSDKDGSGKGQKWIISFDYENPDDPYTSNAWMEFKGDQVNIGDYYYTLDGLDRLFDSVDCEVFTYLKDYSDAPKIDPSY